jgi:hypothetical protein
MSSNNIITINAAYVATWKKMNPKLKSLKTDGHYLEYNNEKIDISNIYMQDILNNPNLYYSINSIEAVDLFNVIKLHIIAMNIKEKELEEKVRRYNEYEYQI